MESQAVALFGEAEKGDLKTIYYCKSLEQLYEFFGQPPDDTEGLFYAVKTILSGFPLIYFRVLEEGMSINDYLLGLRLLKNSYSSIPKVGAIFLPRMSIQEVIEESLQVCREHHGLLIMCEKDFYDYLSD